MMISGHVNIPRTSTLPVCLRGPRLITLSNGCFTPYPSYYTWRHNSLPLLTCIPHSVGSSHMENREAARMPEVSAKPTPVCTHRQNEYCETEGGVMSQKKHTGHLELAPRQEVGRAQICFLATLFLS
jgi:hypothetical protein